MSALWRPAEKGAVDAGEAADALPLVIDLDNGLAPTNLLLEGAVAYARAHPWRTLQVVGWMASGKAGLRRGLAGSDIIDVTTLPFDRELVRHAEWERSRGRKIYLVTAADTGLAARIADRLAFVEGVIHVEPAAATDLAALLAGRFPDGFDYAGSEVAVWLRARRVIATGASAASTLALAGMNKPVTIIPRQRPAAALFRALRMHHWLKNLVVLVAPILSGAIVHAGVAASTLGAFLGLCLVASGTYLVNDLWDLPHDRRHVTKRHRPLASGALPLAWALPAAIILIVSGLAITAATGRDTLLMAVFYLAITLAYTAALKRIPVLDCFVLAALFTLRIAIGITTADVYASPWLLVFAMFLFASLSFAKRYSEILPLVRTELRAVNGRGYLPVDAPLVLGFGLASSTASILIMVLYLINDAFGRDIYGNPHWLWLLPSVLFLWVSRIWLLAQRGRLDEDPVAFAIRDRTSLLLAGAAGVAMILAWAGAPL